MSESATRARGEATAGQERARPLPAVKPWPWYSADYWLAIVAIVVLTGVLFYVHYCRPGVSPGRQVFASTAGPPPPVRWSSLARPQCPHCGGEVAAKSDRCTHCGRCFVWSTSPCPNCHGEGHVVAVSSGSPSSSPTECVCPTCHGDGLLGDD